MYKMDWLMGPKRGSNYSEQPMGDARVAAAPSHSLSQAQQIVGATDGLSDKDIPASIPKWNLVLPQNPIQALGSGSEKQIDFNINCADVGKITQILVNFNITTEAGKTPQLLPTPYFVNRVDTFLPTGEVIETLYNDFLFKETCSLVTDQEVNRIAPLYNFVVTPGATTSSATVDFTPAQSNAGDTLNLWLSLNASFLGSAQPYLKGCGTGYFKVRLYLAPNIDQSGIQATQGVVTCNWCNLWVSEAVLSATAEKALARAHENGIQYNSAVRNLYSLTMVAVAPASPATLQLQGFYSESAGFHIEWKPSNANADALTRIPVESIYMSDSQGRQITQTLYANLIEAIISPAVVPVSSYFINSPFQTTYIFPFATNISRVLEGRSLGSYLLTGNERITVQTLPGVGNGIPAGALMNVTSWDYAKLVVVNNKPRFFVLGSNN
jgi:hypothetical protein